MLLVKNLTDIMVHPATYLILGDTGEGKTATMAAMLQWFHEQEIWCGMVEKVEGYPKWIHNIPSNDIQLKHKNSVLALDDAHNYFYAGEEYTGEFKALDIISRARRHGGKRSVIYTTQQSNVLTRKLVGMTTTIIFKRPSVLQIKFERREVQPLFETANEVLKENGYQIDQGYAVGKVYEGIIQIDKPAWFTQELSEADLTGGSVAREKNKSIITSIIGGVSMIGRRFG